MEEIDAPKAGIGQRLQDVERIAHVEANVLQFAVAHLVERADHAVEERLAPDEAVIGPRGGLSGGMRARAAAALERERASSGPLSGTLISGSKSSTSAA